MVGQQIVDLHTGVPFSLGALRFLLVGMVVVGQFPSSHPKTSETLVSSYARGTKRKTGSPLKSTYLWAV